MLGTSSALPRCFVTESWAVLLKPPYIITLLGQVVPASTPQSRPADVIRQSKASHTRTNMTTALQQQQTGDAAWSQNWQVTQKSIGYICGRLLVDDQRNMLSAATV